MKTIADRRFWLATCVVIAGCLASPIAGAQSAANTYETHLGMTGIADNSMPAITGSGTVQATLNGQTLQVNGQMMGLNAPATDAHLMLGAGIGIPGPEIPNTDLAVADGKISGAVTLTGAQVAALRAGQIYVQVNSAKSPAPAGHLWGWLLPAHAKAAEYEPQMGGWYLPQGAGLNARQRKSNQ